MCSDGRPNAKDVFGNLRARMPLGRKIRLLIKNSALKLIKMRNCCGNRGEPGC